MNVETFYADSREIANKIIEAQTTRVKATETYYVGPVPYYPAPSMQLFSPTTYNISIGNSHRTSHPQRGRENNESSQALQIAVGIVAGVVFAVGSYYLGQNLGHLTNASTGIKEAREWKNHYQPKDNIYKIATLREQIFGRIRNNAIKNLILTTAFVAAASVALSGAIVSSPTLMIAAGVVTFGAICATLFKQGLDSTDQGNLTDAKEIKNLLTQTAEAPTVLGAPAELPPSFVEGNQFYTWQYAPQ